jgi:hypothetical protein
MRMLLARQYSRFTRRSANKLLIQCLQMGLAREQCREVPCCVPQAALGSTHDVMRTRSRSPRIH